MAHDQRYIDRSRIEAGHYCPTKRESAYDAPNGTLIPGYVPRSSNEHLLFGSALHIYLDIRLSGGSVEDATMRMIHEVGRIEGFTPDLYPRSDEYIALAYGLAESIETTLLPRFLDTFTVIGTEIEITLPLPNGYQYMTRIDAAVRRKADGIPFVIEWKTTSYPDRLLFQYERRLQMLMEAEALRRYLRNEWVGGVIVIGFDKGRMSAVSPTEEKSGLKGKRRLSPFTYAYRSPATGWETGMNWSVEWKAKWTRHATWASTLGIPLWLEWLHKHAPTVFSDVIIDGTATPLHYHPEIVERVIAEIVTNETVYALQSPKVRNYGNCHADEGIMNAVCEYDEVCHGMERLDGDLFRARIANHPIEGSTE